MNSCITVAVSLTSCVTGIGSCNDKPPQKINHTCSSTINSKKVDKNRDNEDLLCTIGDIAQPASYSFVQELGNQDPYHFTEANTKVSIERDTKHPNPNFKL